MSGHRRSRKNSGRKRIAPSSSELREKHKEALAIVAKEEAMKNGYNSLLKQLATPSAPANKTTSLLSNDELEELFEEASNPAYVPNQERPIRKLPAPPMVAPRQQEYISLNSTMEKSRKRRCYHWPYCQKAAVECGGGTRYSCSEVNSGRVARPDPDTLAAAKCKARNEEKKKKKRHDQAARRSLSS